MKNFRGCFTAMVTPFRQDNTIDFDGLKRNIEFQIKGGISGLVPLGTTGESPVISDTERSSIITFVVDKVDGRVPVIVGTGTNNTEKTIRYSKEAERLGADAVLVVSPYYNKPTQECLYRHFTDVADSVEIPVIIYNIQSRTGVNIETPTLKRLAERRNIIGVKEASGNLSQIMDVLHELPEGFLVLSGDDNLTLPIMSMGGAGVISVVSNLFPAKVSGLVKAALEHNYGEAGKLHFELLPVFKAAFIETNPMPIKAAMNFAGLSAGNCRPPLYGLLPPNEERIRKVIETHLASARQ